MRGGWNFHPPTLHEWLVRGRLYMPNQRYESHHKICNLRYETHGYRMSAYEITAKFKRFNALWFAGYKGRTLGVASLGSATRILDWRIFIDTTTSMLYTKPTSRSQTNNSYDYEAFIIVIILTTFLSADPKPDIRSRIWSQNSVPVRQEIPFWWTIQCREHFIWLIFLHTYLCKNNRKSTLCIEKYHTFYYHKGGIWLNTNDEKIQWHPAFL